MIKLKAIHSEYLLYSAEFVYYIMLLTIINSINKLYLLKFV